MLGPDTTAMGLFMDLVWYDLISIGLGVFFLDVGNRKLVCFDFFYPRGNQSIFWFLAD